LAVTVKRLLDMAATVAMAAPAVTARWHVMARSIATAPSVVTAEMDVLAERDALVAGMGALVVAITIIGDGAVVLAGARAKK
jgi:hypothetical protein